MKTDVEDLLREGMEQFTRELTAPADLIDRALRRRRLVVRRSAAGATAALAAAAVAVVVIVVPGSARNPAPRSVVLAADVVQRVNSALSVAGPGEIAQMTVTRRVAVPGGKTTTTTAQEWSYGNQWRSMSYSAAGHPVYDEGYRSSSVFTLVSYVTKTWVRERGLGRPAPLKLLPRAASASHLGAVPIAGPRLAPLVVRRGCEPVIGALPSLFEPGLPGVGLSPITLPGIGFSAGVLPTARALRSAIACGTLRIAGRQTVNGIDAVELTSRRNSPVSETIWVSPTTYLPVRVVVRSDLIGVVRQTADITWLQPTAQNLAKLTVQIPAGFRRARLLMVALPVAAQIQGVPIGRLRLFGPHWARRHSS